jgi:ABC-type glutathione transport system ATPase component
MSEFLTPTQPPRSSQSLPNLIEEDDDDEEEKEEEKDSEHAEKFSSPDLDQSERSGARRPFSVIKRLRERFPRQAMHRSESNRRNHLQRLYFKRRVQGALLRETMTSRSSATRDMPAPISDDSILNEMKGDTDDDEDMKILSARIHEMFELLEDYNVHLSHTIRDEPLEVLMENVTYTVLVDPNTKLETVFNTSCLYPIYKFYKRRFLGEEARKEELEAKKILDRISLAFKPGKMYLVLGPPGSGKSTLLRTIAGRLRPQEDEILQGKITYNGRELKVSSDAQALYGLSGGGCPV